MNFKFIKLCKNIFALKNKNLSEFSYSTVKIHVTEENQNDLLRNTVTPLHKIPYQEQLKLKENSTNKFVKQLNRGKKLTRFKTEIKPIIPSIILTEYRNKDCFSVGRGIDGNNKTVGFYIGSYSDQKYPYCASPKHIETCKKQHRHICDLYQEFLSLSNFDVCSNFNEGGYWRNLIVRSNVNNDLSVTVMTYPKFVNSKDIENSKKDLTHFFLNKKIINLQSLLFQACSQSSCTGTNNVALCESLIGGSAYLYDYMGNYKFRISPNSFFQINSKTAEIMYIELIKLLKPSCNASLLDINCGIGPISFMACNHVRGCIGIDSECVDDATFNAINNNISNCHFISGKVEEKLLTAFSSLSYSSDILVSINAGNKGINTSIIKLLRNSRQIKTIAYISSQPKTSLILNNLYNLCNPKLTDSSNFYLTKIQTIDLFPHTPHYKLIWLFQR